MKMKRFLIAALALALLIALAPSLPLHTASAATVVTGVTITGIDAPVAGAKPDYTASGSGAGSAKLRASRVMISGQSSWRAVRRFRVE